MAISLVAKTRRIDIEVEGETLTLICRQPTAQEHATFLASRFKREGNKTKTDLWPARAAFMRQILVGVENATWTDDQGYEHPIGPDERLWDEDKQYLSGLLNQPVNDWRDLIPANYLSTAATEFEEVLGN